MFTDQPTGKGRKVEHIYIVMRKRGSVEYPVAAFVTGDDAEHYLNGLRVRADDHATTHRIAFTRLMPPCIVLKKSA